MIYAFERGRNDVDSVYLLAGYCNGSELIINLTTFFFFSSLALFIILHGIFVPSLRSSLVLYGT